MKVTVNIRDLLADSAEHNDLLLFHGTVEIDDLLETNEIAIEQELDLHDLLAERRAIALIWDTDMLQSTYPHLSQDQAWKVLQECERHYSAENGLSWDDVAEVVGELFAEPADRLKECASRIDRALQDYSPDRDLADVVDLLADIRHWCDQHEQNFAALNGQAYDHYLNQRNHKEA